MQDLELTYLKSLSKQFPTIADAATEIINLQAILSLPKGTEHFLTDIHGEYEQFNHVLKNGSGSVKRKIDEEFGNTLSSRDKRSLATLIYYPMEKLELVMQQAGVTPDICPAVAASLEKAEATGKPAGAMVLPDGSVVTGRTSPLLGASAALLLMFPHSKAPDEQNFIDGWSWALFGGVFISSVKKVNPILLIALSAAAGILIYYVF